MAAELAFEEIGVGAPVVILHDLFGSGRNWRNVARALSSSHRVLCADLRNHGRSPFASTMAYQDMAEDVLRLIRDQSLLRPALIGHSMGGKVAMALALLHSDVVGSLIAIDVAPVSHADRLADPVRAIRSIGTRGSAARSEIFSRMALALTQEDPATLALLVRSVPALSAYFDWRLNLPAIGIAAPELGTFPVSLRSRRFGGSLNLIVGAKCDYIGAGGHSSFAPMFQDVTIDVIEDAGHWVHADQPASLVEALRQALSRRPHGAEVLAPI